MTEISGIQITETPSEVNRNLCQICKGYRKLCGKGLCPILVKAKSIAEIQKTFSKTDFFGASPPSVFVGEYGYPKVSIGPLVPPIAHQDTTIFDAEDLWIHKPMDDIVGYRTSLVRGKSAIKVQSARDPQGLLEITQELVMAGKPIDTEMSFIKRPNLDIVFSPRVPPAGPSGIIKKTRITENPKVPKPIEKVVGDTDLKAIGGIINLYDNEIPQRQITRLLSIGLFGTQKRRRLVPTTWSITATDDILGKRYWKRILNNNWINEVQLFGYKALGNNVQILLYPSGWMFEAFEYWLISSGGKPDVDWETWKGRKTYADVICGAYYATRLPVLEYLMKLNRQAGAMVFMEVDKDWIPLGVWRFREIAKEALKFKPLIFNSLEEGFK
ncbi:MAG: hypothetical protein ACFFDW_10545, partial [Candidatus Thorarchaeota archaeon]